MLQAAVMIQKHVRGLQARQLRTGGTNQGGPLDSRSRSPSPTATLELHLDHGMLTVGPEREQVLMAEVR